MRKSERRAKIVREKIWREREKGKNMEIEKEEDRKKNGEWGMKQQGKVREG